MKAKASEKKSAYNTFIYIFFFSFAFRYEYLINYNVFKASKKKL